MRNFFCILVIVVSAMALGAMAAKPHTYNPLVALFLAALIGYFGSEIMRSK